MDIIEFNRAAWDRQVKNGICWTIPVSSEQVAAARKGNWSVLLTATKPVPAHWFPADLTGLNVLCLASGGGQQGPIFAAAGAYVTVLDNSPLQLAQDRFVAERDGLEITTVQGRMDDLSAFPDSSFDMIFHPISNCFAPEILPVWRECFRVLRSKGVLLAGFVQPQVYCLDVKDGTHFLRFSLPYSDVISIDPAERAEKYGAETPLEFSHTFTEQIGGQLSAGFFLVDLYEDGDPNDPISSFMPLYMATRAVKP